MKQLHPTYKRLYLAALAAAAIAVSLGCSAGKLLVQNPTPTPTRYKTPRPTYTFTPDYTATFTPSPTYTNTPTPTSTFTPTPTATPTPEEKKAAPPPAEAAAPPPPPPPAETPTPAEPTATPTPEFPYQAVYFIHDTGSPGETRITAWIRVDKGPGIFKTQAGYQVKVLAPDGKTYLSEVSGPGAADSTMAGTGDNHKMNTKVEIRPYSPGDYTVYLEEGGVQVSPEVKFSLSANPMQYIHLDFFRNES